MSERSVDDLMMDFITKRRQLNETKDLAEAQQLNEELKAISDELDRRAALID